MLVRDEIDPPDEEIRFFAANPFATNHAPCGG
jgi:hypothetical protein